MPRYRLTIEYDGTPFCGWQSQVGVPTVQDALEAAILRFADETVRVRGAGRTDTGVHARGQVAHVDLVRNWEPFRFREALNFHLKPAPVAVLACEQVAPTFDARFSAVRRAYLYRILTRRAPPVLERDRVWWVQRPLDAAAMAQAATALVGHYDFSTFRAAQCQANSPMRTLERFDVTAVGEEVHIVAEARAFLHNQVRSMVGSLKLVGEGRWSRADLEHARDAKDRTACGAIAPSTGLYLMRVDYPEGD